MIHKKKLTVIDNCPICGIEREIKLRQSRKNKPCSKCFHNSEHMLEIKKANHQSPSEETRQKMRDNNWSKRGFSSPFKGKKHSETSLKQLSESVKKQNERLKEQWGAEEYAIRMACRKRKINREDFKGFISPENAVIRASQEMKEWIKTVFIRDDFTCVKCKGRGNIYLTAHHIESFNNNLELRFDVNNGATLCFDCHNDFHKKYGKGDNTLAQFNEWLNEPSSSL